jgi:hypothetical protein
MATILIYKLLESVELVIEGRWEDGTWVLDRRNFKEIDGIEGHDAEMLLDRFDGPLYYAVRESEAPLTIQELDLEITGNGVTKSAESGFITSKKNLANKLESGNLDKSKYQNEFIEEIKTWKWYDG